MVTPRCLGQALTLVCHFDSLLSPPFFLSIPWIPICFSDRVSQQAGLGLAVQVQSRLKFVTPSKPRLQEHPPECSFVLVIMLKEVVNLLL